MKLNTLAVALCGALALTLGPTPDGSLGWLSAAQAQEKVSPEVGKALNAVTSLLKAGKAKEALGKIRDVEAISGRSAAETALMEKLRFAAAQQSTDPDTMARAYDALKGAGRLAGAENLQYMAAVAGTYSRVNRHKEALSWATRYFSEGGNDPAMRQVQTAAQYNSGDVGPIVKNTLAEIQAAEKAGQTPSRDKINLLWNAANRAKDANALAFANEKLLQYYPSKEMWANAIASTATRKGFAPRFQLDLYRLRLLSDNMRNDEDYEELASLAGQAGFAEEGRKVIEAGFKAGVLGQGAKAERHQRLKVVPGQEAGRVQGRLCRCREGGARVQARRRAGHAGAAAGLRRQRQGRGGDDPGRHPGRAAQARGRRPSGVGAGLLPGR
jgi:hypothetical protein